MHLLFTSFGIVLGFMALLIVGASGFTAESFASAVILVVVGMLLSLFLLDGLRPNAKSKSPPPRTRKLVNHISKYGWRWFFGLGTAATTVALAANLSHHQPSAAESLTPALAFAAPKTQSEMAAQPAVAAAPSPAPEMAAALSAQAATYEVAAAIGAWRLAWQARDVDSYLAAYATDFQPAGGMTLSDWRAQRQDRLLRARDIHISVEQLEVNMDGDKASARFRQHYIAAGNRDTMRKHLLLVRTDGTWQITEEKADAAAGS